MTLNKVQEAMLEADYKQEIVDVKGVAEHHASRHLPGGEDPIDFSNLTIPDSKTVYVSRGAGSDDNAGSISSPFKTIEKALSVMNKAQSGNREILLQDAGPFNIPEIKGFMGGTLTIKTITGKAEIDFLNQTPFNTIYIRDCVCNIVLNGFTFQGPPGEAYITLTNVAGNVHLNNIDTFDSTSYEFACFLRTERATTLVTNCRFEYLWKIINGQQGSYTMVAGSCVGSNNLTGYTSNDAIVVRNKTITATTLEHKAGSGQIFS